MRNWIEANGVSLRYELSGPGDPTVLLIHELGGSLDSFDELVPLLHTRFRTLRFDQRGFGQSEKVRGPVAVADLVADIAALLDRLGIKKAVYAAGAAFGGGLALAFAARKPERAAGLVVSSPAVGSSAQWKAQLEERADTTEKNGMRSQVDASLDRSYPEIFRKDKARFEAYRLRWLANDPSSYAVFNRMLMDSDLMPELANIRCPTLVLGCVRDGIRPPSASRAVAEAIPRARYSEAEAGHFMPVQAPELFAEQLLRFF
jgi:3-oxoadipate enol-lactonase